MGFVRINVTLTELTRTGAEQSRQTKYNAVDRSRSMVSADRRTGQGRDRVVAFGVPRMRCKL